MKRSAASEIVSYLAKNSIDCAIVGAKSSGKSSIALSICPNAAIIHGAELKPEYLGDLRSVFCSSKQIIIENITADGMKFLEPFLSARSILGSRFECVFLITSREHLDFGSIPAVEIEPIDAAAYISRARERGIHPSMIALLNEDAAFFGRHGAAKIEALSKALSARPAAKTLPPLIKTFLGADENAKDFLVSAISAPIESIASASISTDENARAYEDAFAESLKTNPKSGDAAKFADYVAALSKNDQSGALRMLFSLLNSQKGSEALDAALAKAEIRAMIDRAVDNSLK